jgi:predicted ATPase
MLVVLSGCSGGGKSTLIDALGARGHATVAEPGRRIVRAGGPTPWEDGPAFAHACIALALSDLDQARRASGPVFFDRCLHDNALALDRLGHPVPPEARITPYDRVILFPPWPEIRVLDAERRQSMAEAEAEYHALAAGYPALGYPVAIMRRRCHPLRPGRPSRPDAALASAIGQV